MSTSESIDNYQSTGLRVLEQWFWVEDPVEKYFAAMLESYDASDAVLKKQDGTEHRIPSSTMGSLKLAAECIHHEVDDLLELDHFNDRLILHHLRRRFKQEKIYTEIGDILVCFNPQRKIKGLYGKDMIQKYQSMTAKNVDEFEPHIFKFAQESYLKLLHSKENQSLFISGQCGSGQSFNKNHALKYLLQTIPDGMKSKSEKSSNLKNIATAVKVLECFGSVAKEKNADTTLFGIWIDLEIEFKTKQIVGCTFKEYLLEAYRLLEFPMKSNKERSFHVLEIIRAEVEGSDDSRYLPDEPPSELHMSYDHLMQSLSDLGCTKDDSDGIINVMKAIIHLGRLTASGGVIDESDREIWTEIFKLLGIQESQQDDFLKLVQSSVMLTTSRQVTMPSKQEQILEMLDQTAVFLYRCLFRYLFVNFSFIFKRSSKVRESKIGTIGIFNFPGMEAHGDLNEFVENWAAERLEELYLRDIFNDELDVYKEEGISPKHIMSKAEMQQTMEDSWSVLKMLEKPKTGMLSIIDHHTKLYRSMDSDDDALLRAFNNSESEWSGYYKPDNDGFIIQHYGGDIKYDITDFLKQNDAFFPKALMDIFTESKSDIIAEAVKLHIEQNELEDGNASDEQTVTKQLQHELNDLIDRIKNSDPHFIRCFRIHHDPNSVELDSNEVFNQLKPAGIHHVIDIRNLGLPHRMQIRVFVERYAWLLSKAEDKEQVLSNVDKKGKNVDYPKLAKKIVVNAKSADKVQCGTKHVFMTSKMYSKMDRMRDDAMRSAMKELVTKVRAIMARREAHEMYRNIMNIKLSLRSTSVEKTEKALNQLEMMECTMELKDVVWERHHIVKEARKLVKDSKPREPTPPPRRKESISTRFSVLEFKKKSRSNSMVHSPRAFAKALKTDSQRASIELANKRLEVTKQESANAIKQVEQQYQTQVEMLQEKLEKLAIENAKLAQRQDCTENQCLEEEEEVGRLKGMLSLYGVNPDGLDHMGLSECPTLEAPTAELFAKDEDEDEQKEDEEPNQDDGDAPDQEQKDGEEKKDGEEQKDGEEKKDEEEKVDGDEDGGSKPESVEEPKPKSATQQFETIHGSIRSQLSDGFTALRIAQDFIRQRDSMKVIMKEEDRMKPKEAVCTLDGLQSVHNGLDDLKMTMNSWDAEGGIASSKHSVDLDFNSMMIRAVLGRCIGDAPVPKDPKPYSPSNVQSDSPVAMMEENDYGMLQLPSLQMIPKRSTNESSDVFETPDVREPMGNPLDELDAFGNEKADDYPSLESARKETKAMVDNLKEDSP